MPNKTIYIKNEHLSLFEDAQAIAGGESVSAVIVEALQAFVRQEAERRAHAEKETTMSTLIQGLLTRAIAAQASDIHLQPTRDGNQLRFRVDGVLRDVEPLPQVHYESVVEQLQALAARSGGSPAPRGGILSQAVDGQPVDLRVSVVQSVLGPSLTARILLSDAELPPVERFEPGGEHAPALRRLMQKSHGLILLTGASGAGKTTTAYGLLRTLDRKRHKVMTIEDPVESIIDDCVQIPLDLRRGEGFMARITQAMLSDPDALYVSEIRDRETADLLVKCALTGHLVLSCLHAPTAIRALHRLIDVGLEPFMVRDAVVAVVAQRLVRRLCPDCKTLDPQPHPRLEDWGLDADARFYRAVGCERCGHTGFRGRMALFEILEPSETLGRALLSGESPEQLERLAREEGMRSLLDDGLARAIQGHTTVSEVLRVIGET